jgi:hypothetical protein
VIAALLAVGAIAAGLLASLEVGMVTCALLLLALLYNGGGKRIPVVGNLLMGSCRSTNFLLGAAAVLPLPELARDPSVLHPAVLLGIYIAGVTAVSVLEDVPPRRASFLFATAPLLAIPIVLAGLGSEFSLGGLDAAAIARALNAAALSGLIGLAIRRGVMRISSRTAVAESASTTGEGNEKDHGARHITGTSSGDRTTPAHPADEFVRSGLQGIFLIDAGILLSRGLFHQAAAEYGLFILAWLWRRRSLQSTA